MLTVLKIIGIALLAILALVLLILLIVLFVPLRLDIRARYEEEIRARVTVSWLLKALLVRLEWLKDHGLLRVKLLGLKTLMKKHLGDWGPESEGQKIAPEDNPPAQKAEAEAPPAEEKTEETAGKTESKGASKKKEELAEKPETKEEGKKTESIPAEEGQKAEEAIPRLEALSLSIERFEAKWDEIQGLLDDEKNRKTLRRIGKQLKRIARHLSPTKWTIEGELGFEDPYKTGRIMGLIYSLYGIFGEHLRIQGNYEGSAMRLRLELKGRIRLGLFVGVLLNLLLDGNLRKWIKKLTNKGNKENEGTADQAEKEKQAA